jgi:anti-sigma factor ChrR (cupin superfamily)
MVTEHLSLDQVRAYVRGALHPSTLVATDDHLEACAACRAALARESDASFGAEAFGRALASPEARAESPHLTFEHLRGAVEGTLAAVDGEWVDIHVRLCAMCAEELRDLERYAATLPARPQAIAPAAPATLASAAAPLASPYAASPRASAPHPRSLSADEPDEPPARYGETAPARLPLWVKLAAAGSAVAILQLWAC